MIVLLQQFKPIKKSYKKTRLHDLNKCFYSKNLPKDKISKIFSVLKNKNKKYVLSYV